MNVRLEEGRVGQAPLRNLSKEQTVDHVGTAACIQNLSMNDLYTPCEASLDDNVGVLTGDLV